jgi:hypothetical protein
LRGCTWFHRHPSSRRQAGHSRGRAGIYYVFRFPRLADFVYDPSARVLRPYPTPGLDPVDLRHLLLDNVLPLILTRSSFLVLHSGSVLIDGQAVAFLGESGSGKSTLTAAFVRDGHHLVTDDCLALAESARGFSALTSYAGLKLWPDSAASTMGSKSEGTPVVRGGLKLRLRALDTPRERYPLRRLYLLSRGHSRSSRTTVSTSSLSASEAFIGLVENTQILDPTDPSMLKQSFDRIGRLLEKVPVCRLNYPRDYSKIRAVREAVLRDLAKS